MTIFSRFWVFLAIYCLYLSKMLKICEESWRSLQIRVHMFIFFHPKVFSVVLLTWVSILSWRSLLNFGIFGYILLLFSLKMLYICKGKMILVKKCKIEQRSPKSPKLVEQLRKLWMKKNEHMYPNLQRSPRFFAYF